MQNELSPQGYIEILLNPGCNIEIKRDRSISCNRDVLQWCIDEIHDIWSYDVNIVNFQAIPEKRYQLKFLFRNPSEAVLFKLTWA